MDKPIETVNDFLVAGRGDGAFALLNVGLTARFTKEQAIRLAAWLVVMADRDNEFPAVLEAVRSC